MRRSTFLAAYVAGVVLAQAGSPWAALSVAAFAPWRLDLSGVVALVVPVALIAIAVLRGQGIGLNSLYAWPATALVVSGLPFFTGWTLVIAGQGHVAWPPIPDAAANVLGMASVGVPLLLHLACCLRGAAVQGAAA